MRVDAHQHYWRYTPADYGWIGPDMQLLQRDYLPRDLAPCLAAAQIDASLAVQARQSLEETRFLLELAADDDSIAGVVGWVDLCAPDLDAMLAAFEASPKLVGLRHGVQDEPDDAFLERADFRRGVAQLARQELVYELLIHPRHLPYALDFARALPEVSLVLDHLAKPFIARAELEPWASGLRDLAALPNVACKVSGLVTEADWSGWKPADFTPYLDVAFEAFGEERVLFGSDWPVALLAADYPGLYSLLHDFTEARLDPEGRARFFGGNAERLYHL